MSTAWGYKCLTCSKTEAYLISGNNSDWQLDKLRQLYRIFPILRRLFAHKDYQDLDMNLELLSFRDSQLAISFLRQHYRHEIVLTNEYDDVSPIKKEPS